MEVNNNYPPEYWDNFYERNSLGWDIGYVSTPLKEYFDQLINKKIKILIPGAGNGWEAEYLFKNGFNNTFMLDFSPKAIERFIKRCPSFPTENIIETDFFLHNGKYDLIVEQTFFSSLPRSLRDDYAAKIFDLLFKGGKFTGLLFNHEFPFDEPPFGGTPQEYKKLFSRFRFKVFETAYNSIKPRRGREIFFILEKPLLPNG
jgi:thiopurine S-methyltransferase